MPNNAARLRRAYLMALRDLFGTVTLPLGDAMALEAVFQPLWLRRTPDVPEDRATVEAHDAEQDVLLADVEQEDQLYTSRMASENLAEREAQVIATNGADALAHSPSHCLVILGGPGAGKTTVLKDLLAQACAGALADDAAPLPIFLALPEFARVGLDLHAALAGMVARCGVAPGFADVLHTAITTGHAFLCLDGLDEVAPAARPDVIRFINRQAAAWGSTWIVGSRFVAYKGGQFGRDRFAEWELAPLDDALQTELVRRLLAALSSPIAPEDVLAALAAHSHTQTWRTNPLLLSLATILYARNGALPANRVALYKTLIDAVLASRTPDPAERDSLQRLIAVVALRLFATQGRTLTRADLRVIVADLLPATSSEAKIQTQVEGILSAGVLDVVAHETYTFRHQTLQEYLAATALADMAPPPDPLPISNGEGEIVLQGDQRDRRDQAQMSALPSPPQWGGAGGGATFAWSKRTYSRWAEILAMLAGVLARDHGDTGQQIASRWLSDLAAQRDTDEGDPGDLCLTLAKRGVVEMADALAGPCDPALFSAASDVLRQYMEVMLNRWESKSHLATDADYLRTWFALPAGVMAEAAQVCFSAIVTHSIAEEIIATLAPVWPIEWFMDALATHPQQHGSIIRLLGMLDDRAPVDFLLSLLDDPHEQTRSDALHALAYVSNRIPKEVFIHALSDPGYQVRANALWILGAKRQPLPPERIEALMHDAELMVCERLVMRAFTLVPEPYAFLAPLLKSAEYRLYASAIIAMCEDAKLPALALLAPFLRADAPERFHVARTLVEKQGVDAPLDVVLPILEEAALRHEVIGDDTLSERVLEQLDGLGNQVDPQIFVRALETGVGTAAWRVAAHAAGRRRLQAAVPGLLKLINAYNHSLTRVAAVEALAQIQGQAAVPLLRQMMRDHDPALRVAAARALGRQPQAPTLDEIVRVLTMENGGIRAAALRMYQQLGDGDVDALRAALGDDDLAVRQETLRAIVRQGSADAIDALMVAFDDASLDVRYVAVHLAEPLMTQFPTASLLRFCQHTDVQMRRFAYRSLAHRQHDLDAATIRDLVATGEGAMVEWFLPAVIDQVPVADVLDRFERSDHQMRIHILHAYRMWIGSLPRAEVEHILADPGAVPSPMTPLLPDELLAGALADASPLVRCEAIGLLHYADNMQAHPYMPMLLRLLCDTEIQVRLPVVEVLRRFNALLTPADLEPALTDGDGRVRAMAVLVLGALEPAATDRLATCAADLHAEVRAAVQTVALMNGASLPVVEIVQLLQAPNIFIKNAAQRALDAQTGEVLLAHVHDKDRAVRSVVAKSIWQRADQMAESTLLATIASADPVTYVAIMQGRLALRRRTQHRLPLSVLLALRANPSETIRRLASYDDFVAWGDAVPVEVFWEGMGETNEHMRASAARAAGKLGPRIPTAPLFALLADEAPSVRVAALEALVQLGATVPATIVLAMLDDIHEQVRDAACKALLAQHPERVAEVRAAALAVARGAGAGWIFAGMARRAIAAFLGEMGEATPEICAWLAEALEDDAPATQIAVARSLGQIHHTIPDAAIRTLYRLRRTALWPSLRRAADEALAAILADEGGIEDA